VPIWPSLPKVFQVEAESGTESLASEFRVFFFFDK